MLLLALASSLALAPAYASVALDGFPFVRQKPDFCGEADVEMALARLGRSVSQDEVFALGGVDPGRGRGLVTDELAQALRALGFDPGEVWHHPRDAAEVEELWRALHADLVDGTPSIVCMHYSDAPTTTEHFRLVTGYDAARDEVIYQEPAEDDGVDRRMARALFLKLWDLDRRADRATLIRLRVREAAQQAQQQWTPTPTPTPTATASPSAADAVQHVMVLRRDKRVPEGMTIAWEPPFLVIGDEAPARVRERARSIVAWTTERLLRDFFDETPGTLHDVWILKDAASYRRVSGALFDRPDPGTPYGYYLDDERALIMNIQPGYGTLTHELVHPFMDHAWRDVGDAPPWLNEGLASLFEQPRDRDGHLVGGINWRLPRLQQAIRDDEVPAFSALVAMNDTQFYGDDSDVHYATARYLCYWLQERGLLPKLVKRAHALRQQDPTGLQALREVLGVHDVDRAEPAFLKFAAALRR